MLHDLILAAHCLTISEDVKYGLTLSTQLRSSVSAVDHQKRHVDRHQPPNECMHLITPLDTVSPTRGCRTASLQAVIDTAQHHRHSRRKTIICRCRYFCRSASDWVPCAAAGLCVRSGGIPLTITIALTGARRPQPTPDRSACRSRRRSEQPPSAAPSRWRVLPAADFTGERWREASPILSPQMLAHAITRQRSEADFPPPPALHLPSPAQGGQGATQTRIAPRRLTSLSTPAPAPRLETAPWEAGPLWCP